MVTGVTWKPYYDLHATTSDGKPSSDVSLHYCANITQNTGEDWTNAVLTLSTANSQALHSLTVPKVDPLRLHPVRPSPASAGGAFGSSGPQQAQAQQQQVQYQQAQYQLAQQQLQQRAQMLQQAHSGVGPLMNRVPVPLPPQAAPVQAAAAPLAQPAARMAIRVTAPAGPPPAFDEEFEDVVDGTSQDEMEVEFELPEGAVLDKNPLSLAYRVEGRVSLPSDGVAHKVSITVLGFSAALKYVCVPRKTSEAFIEGRIKNTSEYELLAGPVSVFMDDSFVTKTQLGVRRSFYFPSRYRSNIL